jgi:predicted glycogen debranching enzyme
VLDDALRREWLVTDGSGAFACGTVAGALTRRYHALLVAATEPPMGRVVTVAGLSEAVSVVGAEWSSGELYLHTQEWASGAVSPRGHELIEAFWVDGCVPTWRYALPGGVLVKRVWMSASAPGGGSDGGGDSVTFVTYTLERAAPDLRVRLAVRPLCTWREYRSLARAEAPPAVVVDGAGLRVTFAGARCVFVRAASDGEDLSADGVGDWYHEFRLRVETERGMDDVQDLYAASTLTATLTAGSTLALCVSLDGDADPSRHAESFAAVQARSASLLTRSRVPSGAPPWIARLVLAADQFIAMRSGLETVMAGFPWFGDWGRDTMISLPGLALATGRPSVAAGLLRGFARYVQHGLLPNRFPDRGETPEYNTVDATLWYVDALRAYVEETGDVALVRELWPVLSDILAQHVAGTLHGIGVDPSDGLLRAGEPGVQLTWMDAKVDGWVVTPRIGKPVEINALWHNALCCLEQWSSSLQLPLPLDVAALRSQAAASFDRYWNASESYLYDVLDGPDGDDPSIRPNAVIAAALAHTPLTSARIASVVVRAERDLLTSLGLRTLAPGSPGYMPTYIGNLHNRDAAYHQGTVWPWLLGPFVVAHHRAFGDPAAARSFLEPLADHLADAGLGSISEIADASPPHTPRGCPWQAWSVAEVLRAWRALSDRVSDVRG